MKTQKRRANPLRRAILRILRDEIQARPRCALVHTMGADEDGRLFIHFHCLNHDATWRYLLEVHCDATPDTRPNPSSRCPAHSALDSQELQERPPPKAEEAPLGEVLFDDIDEGDGPECDEVG